MRNLRAAPATVPASGALVLVVWWALDHGGFPVASWAPGGVLLAGLLVVAALTVPARRRELPRSVLVAAACLGGFVLWSFASVAWADDPGYAWEGAARSEVYLLAFCLFALWPQQARTARWLLGGVIAAIGLAAVVTLVRLTGDATRPDLLGSGRLLAPTGYPNATACLMLMGVFATLPVAAGAGVAWWLRGLLVGLAVLLCGPALLTLSRGAVYASPVVVLLLLLALPDRARLVLALLPLGGALALVARPLLDVGDVVDAGGDVPGAVSRALTRLVLAAVLAGAVTALAAWLAGRGATEPQGRRRLARGQHVVAATLVALGLVGALAVAGNPVDRVDRAWESFKGGYGENDAAQNRLVAGLGSNRYDFFRVGLRTFAAHPVAGVGADGFYQQYLRSGRSEETPRYPHSVELRALLQTGLVGAVLLLGFLGAAGLAALRAMRAHGAVAGGVAGGAVGAFAFWFVHGSVDWFWEWAGLGLPAFVLAGLACALAPRPSRAADGASPRRAGRGALPGRFVLVALGLVASLPFLSLWTADGDRERAAATFAADPAAAYDRLDRAALVNPFSSAPATLEGSIAVRLGDLPRADAAFARALDRVPDDQYATLEAGSVASARGDRARAERLLSRAAALAPRDALAREALQVVRGGGRIDLDELNRRILSGAQQFGR